MFMQDFTRLSALSVPATAPATPAIAPVTTGLIAGTLLETRAGWQPVETLRVGDSVQTLDGGLARILGLNRRVLQADAQTTVIRLQGGYHDACSDVLLLPGQHVVLDILDAAHNNGAPYAMIAALALLAGPGAQRHSNPGAIDVITPLFADEEVVYANSGLLLHCPGIADGAGCYPENSFFPRFDATEARHFIQSRAARFAA